MLRKLRYAFTSEKTVVRHLISKFVLANDTKIKVPNRVYEMTDRVDTVDRGGYFDIYSRLECNGDTVFVVYGKEGTDELTIIANKEPLYTAWLLLEGGK